MTDKDYTIRAEDYVESLFYGEKRRRFLKENKPDYYKELVESGTLEAHIFELDKEAQETEARLVDNMCRQEGVTEELKANDQVLWVGLYNNILHRARQTVQNELIYV